VTRQPPPPLHLRIPALLREHMSKIGLHTQQITTLQSQAAASSALVPGDWEDILLTGGWSNLAGFIPAQVRIQQAGMSLLIGHSTGGSTANGTVIGTLTSGFFNTVHAHAFTCNSVTGAAAVAHAGTVSNPAVSTGLLADLDSGPNTPAGGNPTPASGSPGGSYSQAYLTALAGNVNQLSAYVSALAGAFNNGNSLHNAGQLNPGQALSSSATSTAVNMNSPVITLGTNGQLTLSNVDPSVTTLSFNELIPLITA
jgi:hypothetical protein